VAASAAHRWYGGRSLNTLIGGRLLAVRPLGANGEVSAELNVRAINNLQQNSYDGWQALASLTYERALSTSIVGSVSVYGRYEPLNERAFGGSEAGFAVGAGAELPWGLNAGASARIGSAWYLGALLALGEARRDLRLESRLYLGARTFRVLGLSPSVEYRFLHSNSNIGLYDYNRHRFEFSLARYF
jgi:outer membrane protein